MASRTRYKYSAFNANSFVLQTRKVMPMDSDLESILSSGGRLVQVLQGVNGRDPMVIFEAEDTSCVPFPSVAPGEIVDVVPARDSYQQATRAAPPARSYEDFMPSEAVIYRPQHAKQLTKDEGCEAGVVRKCGGKNPVVYVSYDGKNNAATEPTDLFKWEDLTEEEKAYWMPQFKDWVALFPIDKPLHINGILSRLQSTPEGHADVLRPQEVEFVATILQAAKRVAEEYNRPGCGNLAQLASCLSVLCEAVNAEIAP